MVTAVPLTFALTLLVNYLAGYSINRVTLFALILSLGLVVDDPIVDVENIYPPFPHAQRAADAGRADGGQRGAAADHPGHAGGDRLLPADVLHHRHDGALHAADGAERAGGHADVDGRRLHDHALAELPRAQAANTAKKRSRSNLNDSLTYRVYRTSAPTVPEPAALGLGADPGRPCSCSASRAAAGLRAGAAEDAAVRQQERVPDRRRHARGNDLEDDRRGRLATWPATCGPCPK